MTITLDYFYSYLLHPSYDHSLLPENFPSSFTNMGILLSDYVSPKLSKIEPTENEVQDFLETLCQNELWGNPSYKVGWQIINQYRLPEYIKLFEGSGRSRLNMKIKALAFLNLFHGYVILGMSDGILYVFKYGGWTVIRVGRISHEAVQILCNFEMLKECDEGGEYPDDEENGARLEIDWSARELISDSIRAV